MPTITRSANDLLRLMIDRMARRRRDDAAPVEISSLTDLTPATIDLVDSGPEAIVRSVLDDHAGDDRGRDVYALLRSFVKHELNETEREMVESHLAICRECGAFVESLYALTGERLVIHTDEHAD